MGLKETLAISSIQSYVILTLILENAREEMNVNTIILKYVEMVLTAIERNVDLYILKR